MRSILNITVVFLTSDWHVFDVLYREDYACEKLKKFFGIAPRARATLNKVRKNAGKRKP